MPFKLKLTTDENKTIESPPIVPNNPKSKFGMEDRKIKREIIRTGKALVKRFNDIIKWECVHYN